MHPLIRYPYKAAGAVSRLAVELAPNGDSKLFRSLRARRGLLDRYRKWGESGRDVSRPLLWIHAPSVGEGLQALAVIQRFRASRPDAQVAFTFFSPSAEQFAHKVEADFHDYLPFDTEEETALAVDALRPQAIVFSKLDVWPLLVSAAVARGVKLGLLSATVPESSKRRWGIARLALGESYAALDVVGAISPADAERLLELGVRGDRMSVTGDTRYDQVWARANAPNPARDALVARYRDDRPTLVGGSTWPSDHKRLLPAWMDTRRQYPDIRLILAPHELSKSNLDEITRWAKRSSLSLSRTSDPRPSATDVLLVDEYGILGDLYAVGDIAYVGGGFHDAGLHSLLEPAAFGAPVLMGPGHPDNRDAGLLVAGGGGTRCRGAGDITARLLSWFRNPSAYNYASAGARRVVEAGIGAAEKSVELVETLFD